VEVSGAMPSQVHAWFESGGSSIIALLKPYLPEDIMAHRLDGSSRGFAR